MSLVLPSVKGTYFLGLVGLTSAKHFGLGFPHFDIDCGHLHTKSEHLWVSKLKLLDASFLIFWILAFIEDIALISKVDCQVLFLSLYRDEIATCIEKAYNQIGLSEAARMLFFETQKPMKEYSMEVKYTFCYLKEIYIADWKIFLHFIYDNQNIFTRF